MTRKHIYLLTSFLIITNLSFAQEQSLVFFEAIKDDSLMMFINKDYRFTEKECAAFIRYTKIDTAGNFNGYFEDRDTEKKLIGKGQYTNGSKNGYFEIYFPEGSIKCKGNYINNIPIGKWEFFYGNGSTDRILMLSEKDTLLMDLFDENGKKKVDNGVGEFNGFVAGLYKVADYPHPITATGKIENGKPEGKWVATFLDSLPYCKEEFEKGRIITGTFPESVMGRIVTYTDRSYLNTFFLNNYLKKLEFFLSSKCMKNVPYSEGKISAPLIFSFDMQRFNSDLRSELNWQIQKDLNSPFHKWDYKEDNELVLRFKVNDKGRAYEFVLLSGWGQRLTDIIQSAIRQQKFPVNEGALKFNLDLHFLGTQSYKYNFNFSRE
ncbi:MAG: hypothetical protein V4685_07320 [Bacteroidota bacterium]